MPSSFMLPSHKCQVEIDMQLDGLPEKVHSGVLGDNSAATAKWRWTCSHGADAAPEWPALPTTTTTATLMCSGPTRPTRRWHSSTEPTLGDPCFPLRPFPCERAPPLARGQGSLARSPMPIIRLAGCASLAPRPWM